MAYDKRSSSKEGSSPSTSKNSPANDFGTLTRDSTSLVLSDRIHEIKKEVNGINEAKFNEDRLTKVVESRIFGSAVGALIILNGIMMGVQTDYDFETMSPSWHTFDLAQEYFFTVAFTLELCLKIFVYKISFFTGPERNWNVFDFCLISFSILDTFILARMSSSNDERKMSVFRMFRLDSFGTSSTIAPRLSSALALCRRTV